MALQKSITTAQGFECPQSYLVVTSIEFCKGRPSQVTLSGFKDKAARLAGMSSVYSYKFSFDYIVSSEINIITQAYDAAKLLPEFLDCVDV